jgi:hypothetical protein
LSYHLDERFNVEIIIEQSSGFGVRCRALLGWEAPVGRKNLGDVVEIVNRFGVKFEM